MKCLPIQVPQGYFPQNLSLAEQLSEFPKQITREHIEQRTFSEEQRQVLADVLMHQYAHTPGFAGSATEKNIAALRKPGTFTVTTGQQLHIMLGPLYVLYKITDTIRLAAQLAREFPEYQFVPIFWMAGEDHDFEEVSTFQLFGKTYHWEAASGGPVGRLSTDSMQQLLDDAGSTLHRDDEKLAWNKFRKCYEAGLTLNEATRRFVHLLFSEHGLVCLDPDEEALKQYFVPHIKAELEHGTYAALFSEQSRNMQSHGLKPEVHVRNPNLFRIDVESGKRNRIERNTDKSEFIIDEVFWPVQVTLGELDDNPSCFSPNVLMRPLYQECILPNLAYISGPTEFIYWQQTCLAMDQAGFPRPCVLRRNSYVIPDARSAQFITANNFNINKLWSQETKLKADLLDHYMHNDDYPQLVKLFQDSMDKAAEMVHTWNGNYLKDLRATGIAYLKILEKSRKEYESQLLEDPERLPEVRRYMKLAERYFSTRHPQERREFSADYLLGNSLLLDFLASSFIAEFGSMYLLLDSR